MTKSKKRLVAILSIVLVAALAVGGTFAYLSSKAGEKNNAFTFADNIRGKVAEPNWDPASGKDLVPGKEIKKDPMITNTSSNKVDEYAAIKVSFQKNDGTVLTDAETARLLTLVTIDWNITDWTLVDPTGTGNNTKAAQIYVYNKILAQGNVSSPLFNTVKINGDISKADMAWLSGFAQDHDDACYTYGQHDASKCTITYKHHVDCAIYSETGAANVAKGGTVNGKTCDCSPAEQHQADCPSLIGTLKANCGHTVADTINGFNLKVSGAVVQADQFTSAADAATVNAFKDLLK